MSGDVRTPPDHSVQSIHSIPLAQPSPVLSTMSSGSSDTVLTEIGLAETPGNSSQAYSPPKLTQLHFEIWRRQA